jgi:hypothetical protein
LVFGILDSWYNSIPLKVREEEGELYFTTLDTVIKPKKGMLVAFTAGSYDEHAVLRAEGKSAIGDAVLFLTFDKDRGDPSLL